MLLKIWPTQYAEELSDAVNMPKNSFTLLSWWGPFKNNNLRTIPLGPSDSTKTIFDPVIKGCQVWDIRSLRFHDFFTP